MKKLLIAVGILAVLVIGSYAALAAFLSPERIKTTVLPTVSDVLGREVRIDGDISISLFPTFGLTLEGLHITNPAESNLKGSMLAVEEARVAVAVLPLFKRELEIREFTLVKPNLSLTIMKDGTPNWAFSGLQGTEAQVVSQASQTAPSEDAIGEATNPTLPLADLRVNNVAVKDGTITYTDQTAGTSMALTKANFDVQMPTLDAVADIKGSAFMNGEKLQGSIMLETPYSLLHGDEAKLKLDANTPYADIITEASLVFTAETTRPVFKADLTQINAARPGFSTSGTGEVTMVWGNQRPELTAAFDLAFVEIDSTEATGEAPANNANTTTSEPLSWPAERLDFSGLDSLDAQIAVKVDQIKANGRLFGPLDASVTLVDRRAVVGLKRFDIYDGKTTGEIVLNARSSVPSASITTHLTGLQIERAMPEKAAPYGASGTVANHIELTTSGHSIKDFVSNMNGTVEFTATQVGATKFNLEKTAEMHLGALGPIVTRNVSKNTIEAIKQKLTTMAFAAVFKEGRGQTVITFSGPVLAQGGEGIINLPAADISLRMNPLLKANEKRDIVLPFYIEGPLNAPAFKADEEGITREVARQAARIGAEKLLDKAIKKGDGKLGIIGNILKDASNRQDSDDPAETEEGAQEPNPVKDLKKAFGNLLGK